MGVAGTRCNMRAAALAVILVLVVVQRVLSAGAGTFIGVQTATGANQLFFAINTTGGLPGNIFYGSRSCNPSSIVNGGSGMSAVCSVQATNATVRQLISGIAADTANQVGWLVQRWSAISQSDSSNSYMRYMANQSDDYWFANLPVVALSQSEYSRSTWAIRLSTTLKIPGNFSNQLGANGAPFPLGIACNGNCTVSIQRADGSSDPVTLTYDVNAQGGTTGLLSQLGGAYTLAQSTISQVVNMIPSPQQGVVSAAALQSDRVFPSGTVGPRPLAPATLSTSVLNNAPTPAWLASGLLYNVAYRIVVNYTPLNVVNGYGQNGDAYVSLYTNSSAGGVLPFPYLADLATVPLPSQLLYNDTMIGQSTIGQAYTYSGIMQSLPILAQVDSMRTTSPGVLTTLPYTNAGTTAAFGIGKNSGGYMFAYYLPSNDGYYAFQIGTNSSVSYQLYANLSIVLNPSSVFSADSVPKSYAVSYYTTATTLDSDPNSQAAGRVFQLYRNRAYLLKIKFANPTAAVLSLSIRSSYSSTGSSLTSFSDLTLDTLRGALLNSALSSPPLVAYLSTGAVTASSFVTGDPVACSVPLLATGATVNMSVISGSNTAAAVIVNAALPALSTQTLFVTNLTGVAGSDGSLITSTIGATVNATLNGGQVSFNHTDLFYGPSSVVVNLSQCIVAPYCYQVAGLRFPTPFLAPTVSSATVAVGDSGGFNVSIAGKRLPQPALSSYVTMLVGVYIGDALQQCNLFAQNETALSLTCAAAWPAGATGNASVSVSYLDPITGANVTSLSVSLPLQVHFPSVPTVSSWGNATQTLAAPSIPTGNISNAFTPTATVPFNATPSFNSPTATWTAAPNVTTAVGFNTSATFTANNVGYNTSATFTPNTTVASPNPTLSTNWSSATFSPAAHGTSATSHGPVNTTVLSSVSRTASLESPSPSPTPASDWLLQGCVSSNPNTGIVAFDATSNTILFTPSSLTDTGALTITCVSSQFLGTSVTFTGVPSEFSDAPYVSVSSGTAVSITVTLQAWSMIRGNTYSLPISITRSDTGTMANAGAFQVTVAQVPDLQSTTLSCYRQTSMGSTCATANVRCSGGFYDYGMVSFFMDYYVAGATDLTANYSVPLVVDRLSGVSTPVVTPSIRTGVNFMQVRAVLQTPNATTLVAGFTTYSSVSDSCAVGDIGFYGTVQNLTALGVWDWFARNTLVTPSLLDSSSPPNRQLIAGAVAQNVLAVASNVCNGPQPIAGAVVSNQLRALVTSVVSDNAYMLDASAAANATTFGLIVARYNAYVCLVLPPMQASVSDLAAMGQADSQAIVKGFSFLNATVSLWGAWNAFNPQQQQPLLQSFPTMPDTITRAVRQLIFSQSRPLTLTNVSYSGFSIGVAGAVPQGETVLSVPLPNNTTAAVNVTVMGTAQLNATSVEVYGGNWFANTSVPLPLDPSNLAVAVRLWDMSGTNNVGGAQYRVTLPYANGTLGQPQISAVMSPDFTINQTRTTRGATCLALPLGSPGSALPQMWQPNICTNGFYVNQSVTCTCSQSAVVTPIVAQQTLTDYNLVPQWNCSFAQQPVGFVPVPDSNVLSCVLNAPYLDVSQASVFMVAVNNLTRWTDGTQTLAASYPQGLLPLQSGVVSLVFSRQSGESLMFGPGFNTVQLQFSRNGQTSFVFPVAIAALNPNVTQLNAYADLVLQNLNGTSYFNRASAFQAWLWANAAAMNAGSVSSRVDGALQAAVTQTYNINIPSMNTVTTAIGDGRGGPTSMQIPQLTSTEANNVKLTVGQMVLSAMSSGNVTVSSVLEMTANTTGNNATQPQMINTGSANVSVAALNQLSGQRAIQRVVVPLLAYVVQQASSVDTSDMSNVASAMQSVIQTQQVMQSILNIQPPSLQYVNTSSTMRGDSLIVGTTMVQSSDTFQSAQGILNQTTSTALVNTTQEASLWSTLMGTMENVTVRVLLQLSQTQTQPNISLQQTDMCSSAALLATNGSFWFTPSCTQVNGTTAASVDNLGGNEELRALLATATGNGSATGYLTHMKTNPFMYANSSANMLNLATQFSILDTNGQEVAVSNLSQCLNITIPMNSSLFGSTSQLVTILHGNSSSVVNRTATVAPECRFYNTTLGAWSSSGLNASYYNATAGTVTCCWTHLSIFGIESVGSVSDIAPSISVTLDASSLATLKDHPWVIAVFTVIFGVYVVFMTILLVQQTRDSGKEYPLVSPRRYLVMIKSADQENYSKANVAITLVGRHDSSPRAPMKVWYQLGRVQKGVIRTYHILSPVLGHIRRVYVENLNPKDPDWVLDGIRVIDTEHSKCYTFNVPQGQQLVVRSGAKAVRLEMPTLSKRREPLWPRAYFSALYTLREGHRFWSVVLKPTVSPVSRMARLTMMLYMIMANFFLTALIYSNPANNGNLVTRIGFACVSWLGTTLSAFVLSFLWRRSTRFFRVADRKTTAAPASRSTKANTGRITRRNPSSPSSPVSPMSQLPAMPQSRSGPEDQAYERQLNSQTASAVGFSGAGAGLAGFTKNRPASIAAGSPSADTYTRHDDEGDLANGFQSPGAALESPSPSPRDHDEHNGDGTTSETSSTSGDAANRNDDASSEYSQSSRPSEHTNDDFQGSDGMVAGIRRRVGHRSLGLEEEEQASKPFVLPYWCRYIAWILAVGGIVAFVLVSWLMVLAPTYPSVDGWLVSSVIAIALDLVAWVPLQMLGAGLFVVIVGFFFRD